MSGYTSQRQGGGAGSAGRIEWVDVAKGVGIFLVVFGHSLGGMIDGGMLSSTGWCAQLVTFIYIFHMPLFFFLAGMFVAHSAKRSFPDYLSNKAAVIVYPYFVWSILEGLLQYYASRYTNGHTSLGNLVTIVYAPINQYWFLYVIFLMYITYWFVRHWRFSNTHLLIFALLLYSMNAIWPHIAVGDVLSSYCSFLLYFALGAKIAETPLLASVQALDGRRLTIAAICGYAVIVPAVVLNVSSLSFLHAALALIGMTATIALAMIVTRSPLESVVRILGVYSLEIYVAHTIFSAAARIAMLKLLGYSDPLAHVAIGTAVGIVFPLLLAIWAPKLGFPYLFAWSRSRRSEEISALKAPAA